MDDTLRPSGLSWGKERGTERHRVGAISPEPPDPLLPARLRAFHTRLPLAGDPPNAVLALPDDRLQNLVALLRDTPVRAPALLPGEWGEFRDLLNNPGRG